MYLLNNLIIIITILLIQVTLIGCIYTSTVCYGSSGLSCTTHSLSCPSPLVIQIINTSYGYRPGCNDVNGLPTCSNTTCCNEKPGDCFVSFSSEEYKIVAVNCNKKGVCTIAGTRDVYDTVCGMTFSAYSRIQYDCVTRGSKTTSTQTTYSGTNTIPSSYSGTNTIASTSSGRNAIPSTVTLTGSTFTTSSTVTGQDNNESDVGSIVGGIFGAIIIIVIIIVVVVFLYKRRKKSLTPPSTDNKMTKQTVTPQYHVIDGPGTIANRKDMSGYDDIELDAKPRVQATAAHLNLSTMNNLNETRGYDEIELYRTSRAPTTDNYDHFGDDKLKIKSSKGLDNYNHIGTHDHSTYEDNYNHIGNNLCSSSNDFESDYNHIDELRDTVNDEDNYNHIGDNDNKNVITDDNYHHIGSGDMKVEGDYDHIGS